MQNVSSSYLEKIKEPSRSFECRVTIGNNVYTNIDIINISIEDVQPSDGFTIGAAVSKSLELTLSTNNTIYSNSKVKLEIGLNIGSTFEYILIGNFHIEDIISTDYSTKLTCYDNMIKFEKPYFSNLGKTSSLKNIVNELATITGVEFTGSLPSYNLNKLEGFTCREILGFVASICGGNAYITRDGKFTIKTPATIDYSITSDNYIDLKSEEDLYKVGAITCKANDKELTKGTLSNSSMEIAFENPWVTESILTDIYNKLKGFEFIGYSMKWQGDFSLDVGDIISITDTKGNTRQVPIFSKKLTYNGGLTSEIGAKGESKTKNEFSPTGDLNNKVNRVVTDLLIVNKALINKADVEDLKAVNGEIDNLIAVNVTITGKLNAIEGEFGTLKANVGVIDKLTVTHTAQINDLKANSATINDLKVINAEISNLQADVGKIGILEADVGKINTLLAGNITGKNIQAGGITSDKLTIANGFITNAMIANLDVSKINAGDISTNKFKIKSDNGGIEIVGATQQFKDKNNKVRIQMGQDTQGNFNFIIRGEDGTTTLIDHTGIKEKAIADDLIKETMIAQDAIGEKQINYSSFITGFNKDTNTNTIKSTKIILNNQNQTLDVAFSQLKTQADGTKELTESHSTTIGIMQGQINTAINNTQITKNGQTILLKDDYNRTVQTVDSMKITIGQHTSKIDGLNSTVSTQTSDISQLKNQIKLKVEQTDITNAVNSIQIGARNLLRFTKDFSKWWGYTSIDEGFDGCKASVVKRTNFTTGTGRMVTKCFFRNFMDYTAFKQNEKISISCWVYIDSSVPISAGSNNIFVRLYNSNNAGKDYCLVPLESIAKDKWVYVEATATLDWDVVANTNNSFMCAINQNGFVKICKPTLTISSKPMKTWTQAPEDVDSAIGTVTAEVTKTNSKVATLETNLSSITQRVSSTESTTTTLTSKVNTAQTAANNAQSTADSKAKVFTSTPTVPYKVGDLWTGGPSGDVMRCKTARTSGSYTASDWEKASKYTDDTKANAVDGKVTTLQGEYNTTKSKVATLETNLDGITQRVSSTESTTSTLTSKVNIVEENASKALQNTDNIWVKDYSVNTTTTLPIKEYNDTNNLNPKYWYEVEGFIDNTSTDNGAMAIFKGDGTNFTVQIIKEKGTTSNHVKFFLNNGVPSVGLYNHTSLYKVRVHIKRIPRMVSSTYELSTTKSKVSSIETNLSSITSRVGTVESKQTTTDGKVTSLETRMSSAESKITESAITNTVKKNFYTKSETDKQITSKGYQTSSQVQQTVNAFELKFQESGGYNLVYNSDFKNGDHLWSISSGAKYYFGTGNWNSPTGLGMAITGQSGTSLYAVQELTNTSYRQAKTFTLSGLVNISSTGTNDSTGAKFQLYVRVTYDDDTKKYHMCNIDESSLNKWQKVFVTFDLDTTKTVTDLRTTVSIQNTTKTIFVSQIMLEVGSMMSPWCPNSSEVYDGVTTIDKEGITVTASNVKSKTTISANGFKITKTDTNTDVFKVNSDARLSLIGDYTAYNGNRKAGYFGMNEIKFYNWWSDTNEEIAYFYGGKTNAGKRSADIIGKDMVSLGIGAPSNGKKVLEANSSVLDIYTNVDFNNAELSNVHKINYNGGIDTWINQVYIRYNQLNTNRSGGYLNLNYWKGGNVTGNVHVKVGNGNNDDAYGPLSCGNFKAYGTKNACVQTSIGYVDINAYETCDYYFGDIGETILDSEGYSYVYIDSIFSETVNTQRKYQVFLSVYGEGSANVVERTPIYFVIKGTPGIEVGYELKAKRKGYEDHRLEREVNNWKIGENHGLDEDYNHERIEFNKKIENIINEEVVKDIENETLQEFISSEVERSIENIELMKTIEEDIFNENIN